MGFDCKHNRTVFIQGGRGMGEHESVSVCADCGEFLISAEKGGVRFSVNFSLHSNQALIAASQSITSLNRDAPPKRGRVCKPLDFAHLRLYQVHLDWCLQSGRQGRETFIVAADSPNQSPQSAANLIKKAYAESYDNNPQMSYWGVHGYALNVLQPAEWTDNGIVFLNTKAIEALHELRMKVEEAVMLAEKEEDREGNVSAYHFKTGSIHRLLAEARKGDSEFQPASASSGDNDRT